MHTQLAQASHGRLAPRAQLSIEPRQRGRPALRLLIKIYCLVMLQPQRGLLQQVSDNLGATTTNHLKHGGKT